VSVSDMSSCLALTKVPKCKKRDFYRLVRRPGFEPGIAGLGDQNHMNVFISVDMKVMQR